eukprot:6227704-Amphidinium_carterae.1
MNLNTPSGCFAQNNTDNLLRRSTPSRGYLDKATHPRNRVVGYTSQLQMMQPESMPITILSQKNAAVHLLMPSLILQMSVSAIVSVFCCSGGMFCFGGSCHTTGCGEASLRIDVQGVGADDTEVRMCFLGIVFAV